MNQFTCQGCGILFYSLNKDKNRKYCSQSCCYENRIPWNKDKKSQQVAWNKNKGLFLRDLKCQFCGEIFHGDSRTRKFCSRRCHSESTKIHLICLECGSFFSVPKYRSNQKFCSKKCQYAWLAKHPEYHYNYKGKKIVTCPICDKKFEIFASSLKKFCSHKCYSIWRSQKIRGENHHQWGKRGEKSSNWRGGISKEPYSFEFDKELKELIRLRDGYKCQKCGCPEIETLQKLLIHHIDYNKKNCKPSNLISLCISCNFKVNYKRSYWTKYFTRKIEQLTLSNLQLHFKYDGKIRKESIIVLCLNCKQEFTTSKKWPKKFCSRQCHLKFLKEHPEKHPNWRGGGILKICICCGEKFKPRTNLTKKRQENQKYCSEKCMLASRKPNSGSFKKGNIPLNPIKKGEHRGLKTEFKKKVGVISTPTIPRS